MALIENVTFLYAKVQNPVPAFNKLDSEWTVDVVCSKADAKKVKKEFPKTSLKEFDNADFTEKFGIEPPFPSQDEQFILKFKKSHIKNGQETPEKYRPRVIQQVGEVREDITFEKLIGNGSKGTMSYRIKETKDYGNFVELQALLITDLVEYKSKAGSVTEDFGPVKLAEAPVQEKVAVKQGPAPVVQEEPEDDLSSDLPF
jgi:hypothetical protein